MSGRPDLAGQAVLLTGASSGIGAATAVALGREGAAVGLVARRGEVLDEVLAQALAAGADERSRRWALDLADLDAAGDLVMQAWAHFGALDAVVNNAAIPRRRHATALAPEELDRVMRVNFSSPARICLAAIPHMTGRGRGTIVNVGSLAGRLGNPGEAAYCASKFALSGFTETLAMDLLHTGVAVRLVTPGPFDTPIWATDADDPSPYDGPLHPPELAAAAILDALRGDAFEIIVPADLHAVVTWKAADIDTYLAGAAAMAAPRSRE